MPNSVTGSFGTTINLTTKFVVGTAGLATEVNNFGGQPILIGPSYTTGLQFADAWSTVFSGLTGSTTIDLTALVGIGSRIVTLADLKLAVAWNCDPTVGHDVQIGPATSNGLVAPFAGTSDYWTIPGGLPGAALVPTTNGLQPVGNQILHTNFPSGWTVDSTHKGLTITVPTGTVANFVLILAG